VKGKQHMHDSMSIEQRVFRLGLFRSNIASTSSPLFNSLPPKQEEKIILNEK